MKPATPTRSAKRRHIAALLAAIDRVIAAAKQAEKARSELVRLQRKGDRP